MTSYNSLMHIRTIRRELITGLTAAVSLTLSFFFIEFAQHDNCLRVLNLVGRVERSIPNECFKYARILIYGIDPSPKNTS